MSVKNDQMIGFKTTVPAGRDAVVKAAQDAAGILGSRAEISGSSTKLTVTFFPGMMKTNKKSPVAAIDLQPSNDGGVTLRIHLERWLTTQQRMMLIPIAPKVMVGKANYVRYLRAFEQELKALGGTIEHSGSWS